MLISIWETKWVRWSKCPQYTTPFHIRLVFGQSTMAPPKPSMLLNVMLDQRPARGWALESCDQYLGFSICLRRADTPRITITPRDWGSTLQHGGYSWCVYSTCHGGDGSVVLHLELAKHSSPLVFDEMPPQGSAHCWYFLASLLRTGLGPIPSNGARNAVLASPSKDTKECQPIGLYNYRQCPKTHRSIVVAFHPEVFRVSLFIFYWRRWWWQMVWHVYEQSTYVCIISKWS
jgi:hypothetical protein